MDMAQQTNIFVFAALFGALMGLIFDLFTLTARLFRRKKIALWIFDGVYCLVCLIGSVLFLLTEGTGRLESYVLIGACAGVLLYFVSISSLCKRFLRRRHIFYYKK